MKKIKVIKSFQTYIDAKTWLNKNTPGENLEIHETSTVKSISKGRGRIPYGRYHVVEINKSFEKHGFEGGTRDGLNGLVQSGHLLPMIRSGGEDHHMVTLNGRHIVLANVNGQAVPFYHSTGLGGKVDAKSGKWYPLLGIGYTGRHEESNLKKPTGVWLNKTHGAEMSNYYGSKHLSAFSKHLDSLTGNILDSKPNTIKIDAHHDKTYDGFLHPETGKRATQEEVYDWHNRDGLSTGWRYKLHPEGPSTDFLGEFAKNINGKMGIEAVNSPEKSGGEEQVRNNAAKIISNIENSPTPNITLREENSQQQNQNQPQNQTAQINTNT
jgi:hypothetical protein